MRGAGSTLVIYIVAGIPALAWSLDGVGTDAATSFVLDHAGDKHGQQ